MLLNQFARGKDLAKVVHEVVEEYRNAGLYLDVTVTAGCDCVKPGTWQTITGLAGCNSGGPGGDRWPTVSPPKADSCSNWGKIVCTNTGSSYEFRDYYNSTSNCMGACIYLPAGNEWKYRFTINGWRWHSFKHVTLNSCNSGGCDQGTSGKYDWEIWSYDCIEEEQEGPDCKESSTLPDPPGLTFEWLETHGDSSNCERNTPCP